jgi:hypothetical protein
MHPATPRRPRGGQPQQTAAVRQTRKPPLPGALRLLSSPLASFLSPLHPTRHPEFYKVPNFFQSTSGFSLLYTPHSVFFKFLAHQIWVGASEMAAAKSPRGARDAGTRGLALQPRAGPDLGSSRA